MAASLNFNVQIENFEKFKLCYITAGDFNYVNPQATREIQMSPFFFSHIKRFVVHYIVLKYLTA